ncbi:hypothetical protein E9536_33770 [Burkholderia sp. LS-044]|nr:hypothetical protein E9536_33770 [Burkholderia sp. LS-044]
MRNKLPVPIVSIASLHRQDPCKPCSRTAFLLRACRACEEATVDDARVKKTWRKTEHNRARHGGQPYKCKSR